MTIIISDFQFLSAIQISVNLHLFVTNGKLKKKKAMFKSQEIEIYPHN